MLSINSGLDGLRRQKRHHFCTLWKITRTDNVSFYFTSRDEPITFDGDMYQPAGSLETSATQLQEGLKARNLESRGIINADDITTDDLRAGRYDNAEITEYLIDARFPWAGFYNVSLYKVRDITFDGLMWQAQVQDISSWLRIPVGELYTRNCRYELGDTRCKKVLTSFTYTPVTVTSVPNQRSVLRASALSITADKWFNFGKITWLTGANAGIVCDVKKYVGATKQFTLWLRTPFDIQNGDTFTAVAGCDHTLNGDDGCKLKFNNVTNFGGFPYIPGNEKALQTPNAS